jgi:hypothetical protein
MSWQIALLLLSLVLLSVVCLVLAIRDHGAPLIKDSEINAHRITPRFDVGRDVK